MRGRAAAPAPVVARADAVLERIGRAEDGVRDDVLRAVLHAQGRIRTPDVRMPLANTSAAATRQACEALGLLGSPVTAGLRQG